MGFVKGLECSPSRRLASPYISHRLFGFLPQPRSAVRILLSNSLAIREVLCAIDNSDEGANLGPVDRQVGKDACSMRAVEGVVLDLAGRHDASSCGVMQLEAQITVVYMGEAQVERPGDDDGVSNGGGVKKEGKA